MRPLVAIRHLLLTTTLAPLLLLAPACRGGNRPFSLPPRSQVPAHPCADWGVRSCEAACNDRSDGDACMVASVAYGEGIGTRKDPSAMQTLERRACELGVMLGCEFYANNFRLSEAEDEHALAREYYERACAGGCLDSCARAGQLALRLDADDKPRDPSVAFVRHQQACDGRVP